MRADWLLMKDVREGLGKLRAQLWVRTNSHIVYEALLMDLFDAVCRTIEEERAINGGSKRYGLRTDPFTLPQVRLGSEDWTREMHAKNYVGRPRWDIIVDRIARQKITEWLSLASPHVEKRVEQYRGREEKRTSSEESLSSESSSPS